MIERLHVVLLATVLAASSALAACKDDEEETAPSCDDLQREADGCQTSDPATKAAFAQVGATCKAQARFTAGCRDCLSGHVCGETRQCDPQCGK